MWLRRIFLLLVMVTAAGAGWLAAELLLPYRGYSQDSILVDIPRGTSTHAIARLLEERGVVRSRIAFEALARWRYRQTLQAGEYSFDHPMAGLAVFDMLAQGKVYELTLAVPEGWTMLDIARQVQQQGFGSSEEFLRAARDPALIRDLAPEATTLEGFLFPATYHLSPRSTPADITAAMVRRFRDVWSGFPEARRNPHGLPVLQLVTLASMVERETPQPEERPIIASVFYNRLQLGQALECDPTVIYALQLANRYEGSLHAADLQVDSPYNTYRRAGLPPGPIGNPGVASLRAALYPPRLDYLYFVADAQGGHFFSRSLAEHNHNVAAYRRLVSPGNASQGNAPPVDDSGSKPSQKKPRKKRP